MTAALTIPTSAHVEAPHTRALRLAWERYESTPIHDQLLAEATYPELAATLRVVDGSKTAGKGKR